MLPSLLAHHVETGRAHHKKTSLLKHRMPGPRLQLLASIFETLPCQSPFGGPGENRTPVHSAFNLKELQQYFDYTIFIDVLSIQ